MVPEPFVVDDVAQIGGVMRLRPSVLPRLLGGLGLVIEELDADGHGRLIMHTPPFPVIFDVNV